MTIPTATQTTATSTSDGDSPSLVDRLHHGQHPHVKVGVSDIDGILRGKYMESEKFLSACRKGLGFCNVVFGWDMHDKSYDNGSYTGWHSGYPDAMVQVDEQSLRQIPWENGMPFALADFVNSSGEPLPICPRQVLKGVIDRLAAAGFEAQVSLEFEWFNFRESPDSIREKGFRNLNTLTPGMFGYSLLRPSLNQDFFHALLTELPAFGIPLEGLHTETGPGVLEAAIRHSGPLEAADRGILFKTAVKQIAYRFGIIPTFMARWNPQLPGSSGHIHQSLWCRKTNKNLFNDSKLCDHYMAGLVTCLPELLVLFAPTVNSYKRLVEGFWAPTRSTWGVENRTSAFRFIPGMGGSEESTRIETRVGGADLNPYLAVAATLAAGLYGIENKLELPWPAVEGSAYQDTNATSLARNLHDATDELDYSERARPLLGAAFVDHYVQTRRWEWRQAQEAISPWELERYFETV